MYFYSYTYNDCTDSIENDKGHLEPDCISVPLGQPIWIVPRLLEKINRCETYITEEQKVTDTTY